MELVYSSSHVCNTLARRELNSHDVDKVREFTEALGDRYILPLAGKLWRSRKITGKNVLQSSRALALQMGKMDAIISTDWTRLTKVNSSDVQVRVEATAAISSDNDWMSFLVTEVHLTRRRLELATTMLPVRLHRHSLARFMERTKQPSGVMIRSILNSLKTATVLSPPAVEHSEDIAVAHEQHLLLGRMSAVPIMPSTYVLAMTPDGPPHELEQERANAAFDGNKTLMVDIMTFVDDGNLTEPRRRLRDVLRRFQDEHTKGIEFLYAARELYSAVLPTADMDKHIAWGREANIAATEVVGTTEWSRMIEVGNIRRGD